MFYPKDRNIHRLPHIYLGDTYYFITARTYNEINYFNNDERKEILLTCLMDVFRKCNESLLAWVILSNHYHLESRIKSKENLEKIIKFINGKSSYLLNKLGNKAGRKIWYQYRDKILKNKKDFWMHFNYIHNNPIKHGSARSLDELEDYKFSSYNFYLKKFGRQWLDSIFEQYPIIDFTALKEEIQNQSRYYAPNSTN